MKTPKKYVYLQLLRNIIIDRCESNSSIIFDGSLCSHDGAIRFTSATLEIIFPPTKNHDGFWHCGKFFMYEVTFDINTFIIKSVISYAGLDFDQKQDFSSLINACPTGLNNQNGSYTLATWNYSYASGDTEKLINSFDSWLKKDRVTFENELSLWKADHSHIIAISPKPLEVYTEGTPKKLLSTKYERNRAARKQCLAIHGTICKICGFDFAKTYGDAFAGLIEVHHLIPISQIKENYVVNPATDLIPVCSNCHQLIHSKKDTPFTVDEVSKFIKKT